MEQLTFGDILRAQSETAWRQGGLPRTYDTLRPGDYVEICRRDGTVIAGWVAMRHPVDGVWQVQVQAETADQHPAPEFLATAREFLATARVLYRPLPWLPYVLLLRNSVWRCVRHDVGWQLGPDPDTVCAWMREQAPGLPHDRWYQLYHGAMAAWPVGVDPAWRQAVHAAFTSLAQEQIPVAEWLRVQRKERGSGSAIWSFPPAIQRRIEREIWPLPGPDRWSAILALRWTRAEHFGDARVPKPDGLLAFNSTDPTIYRDYLRWAIEVAVDLRQLLELLDAWGSNPAPEEMEAAE